MPTAVIASASEAIQLAEGKLDCFVASLLANDEFEALSSSIRNHTP